MSLTYTYADAYLKGQMTAYRETRAMADVDAIATFAASWREKLVILRAYIVACLECQAQPDDLFAQKLKHYRTEWEIVLAQARATVEDDAGLPLVSFSVSLERG
mgnify:CR=1 FL=1